MAITNIQANNRLLSAAPAPTVVSSTTPGGGSWPFGGGGWLFRKTVTVDNTANASTLTDYQVLLSLTSSNFNFAAAKSDGSDLRVTDSDGLTLIPYFLASFDAGVQTASVWAKVPTITGSSTKTLYLYYGNSSPASFDVPPIGMFTKSASNPIIATTNGYLSENMVFDPVGGKYWFPFTNFANNAVGIAKADAPDGPWTVDNATLIVTGDQQGSPHLLLSGGTWYMYYAKGTPCQTFVATASTPNGVYSAGSLLLDVGTGWESSRVLEPYVFQRQDSVWVMLYMGDSGSTTEQVGYATASSPAGPFTKYGSNPVLAFGPAGSFDAQTIADPWCYYFNGIYYVGYTCSPAKTAWQTAYATTTDWVTFTKGNVILGKGNQGSFDNTSAFRGAVSRFGNTYYFPYAGNDATKYQPGLASMSAQNAVTGYPADQVFTFYDDFTGSALLDHVNNLLSTGGSTAVSSGIATLTSGVNTIQWLQTIQQVLGPGYIIEGRVKRPSSDGTKAGLIGMLDSTVANIGRLGDTGSTSHMNMICRKASVTTATNMTESTETTSYHDNFIWWKDATHMDFKIDAGSFQEISTNVPIVFMPAILRADGSVGGSTDLLVDWMRVRKYSSPEPVVTLS